MFILNSLHRGKSISRQSINYLTEACNTQPNLHDQLHCIYWYVGAHQLKSDPSAPQGFLTCHKWSSYRVTLKARVYWNCYQIMKQSQLRLCIQTDLYLLIYLFIIAKQGRFITWCSSFLYHFFRPVSSQCQQLPITTVSQLYVELNDNVYHTSISSCIITVSKRNTRKMK